MTAVMTAQGNNVTATHVATGPTQVIVSGLFRGGSIQLNMQADALPVAPAYTFMAPGAVSVACTGGTSLVFTTGGGGTGASFNVSCT